MNTKFNEYNSLLDIPKHSEVYFELRDYVKENQSWLIEQYLKELNNLDHDGLFTFYCLFDDKNKFFELTIHNGSKNQIIEVMNFATFSDNPFNDKIIIDFLDLIIGLNDKYIFEMYFNQIGHDISPNSLSLILKNKEFETIVENKINTIKMGDFWFYSLLTIEHIKILIQSQSKIIPFILNRILLKDEELEELIKLTEDESLKQVFKKQNQAYKVSVLENEVRKVYRYMLNTNDFLYQVKRYMKWLPKNWLAKLMSSNNGMFDDINDKLLSDNPEERLEQISVMLNKLIGRFNENYKNIEIEMPYIEMSNFLVEKLNEYKEKSNVLIQLILKLIEEKDFNSLKKTLDEKSNLLNELEQMSIKNNFINSSFGQYYSQALDKVFK